MIAIIAAYDKNRAIGKNGKIPWNIPGEMDRFRDLTTGNTVIMGRLTYEEIGKPLKNRDNIVISKTKIFSGENLRTVSSLSEALHICKTEDIFIAGGEKLFAEALPLCEKLFITEIHGDFEGDRFFPDFDKSLFYCQTEKIVGGNIPYTYLTYTRKTFE